MPDALSAAFGASVSSPSSCERSRPRAGGAAAVFLTALLAFLGAVRDGVDASSSASRASFSAFLRACSAFFAASASLSESSGVSYRGHVCQCPPRFVRGLILLVFMNTLWMVCLGLWSRCRGSWGSRFPSASA